MITRFSTREEWLNEAVLIMRGDLFSAHGHKVPKEIKVSCGFPSKGAFAQRTQRIGECWYPQTRGGHQLFISPVLSEPVRVLDVLTHEVVHTIAGKKAGHKAPFKVVATSVGLEGKMTATVAGPILTGFLKTLSNRLGKYPHDPLNKMETARPKDKTYLIKASCACGYVIRITRKWIEEVGLPECPACGTLLLEEEKEE